MTQTRDLRFAVISDIHLGHDRTPTANIVANLRRDVYSRQFLKTIDVLFFAGDVYDHLLSLASAEATEIDRGLSELLRHAAEEGVIIRVLEGTRSHDRHQSIRFLENNEKMKAGGLKSVDLKYFDDVAIDVIEEFGVSVLYVPDDLGPTTTATLERVRALMAEKDLTQVDLAMMHGFFPHQLGNIPAQEHSVHDPQAYLALVKGLIFIGHVHNYSNYERIYAQGSFDRLGHGEEEPKGFLSATLYPSGDYRVQFHENTGATRYITVVCEEDNVTDAILSLDKAVEHLPAFSHVRVQAQPGHSILTNERVLRERHPQFNWTVQSKDREKKRPPLLLDVQRTYTPIVLERTTIAAVLKDRLVQRKYPPLLQDRVMTILNEVQR